jgi:hypothetical protein
MYTNLAGQSLEYILLGFLYFVALLVGGDYLLIQFL